MNDALDRRRPSAVATAAGAGWLVVRTQTNTAARNYSIPRMAIRGLGWGRLHFRLQLLIGATMKGARCEQSVDSQRLLPWLLTHACMLTSILPLSDQAHSVTHRIRAD